MVLFLSADGLQTLSCLFIYLFFGNFVTDTASDFGGLPWHIYLSSKDQQTRRGGFFFFFNLILFF